MELPFELQGEAVTFAPGDQALLVAGEREDALWWVPLTRSTPSPTSTPSSPTSTVPSASASDPSVVTVSAAPDPASGDGTSRLALVAAGVAIVGAGIVGVTAARRMRR